MSIFIIAVALSCVIPGSVLSAVVTLNSIKIYKTHEWLGAKPKVYFLCHGENKTELPDVKDINVLYPFNGHESWQPLTNFTDQKCKRCGFYVKSTIKSDDVFDEWEFCPDFYFGKYTHAKEKEFIATFSCPKCPPFTAGVSHRKKIHLILVVVICGASLAAATISAVAVYRYWQKKKKEADQARFLKLFEEADDIEDELGHTM